DPAVAGVSLSDGLGVGQAGGGDGRGGEGDPRQVVVVHRAPGAVEGVVGDQGAVGGGDVDELGMPGDVPGRPDPRVGGPQLLVDQDLAALAGFDPDRVQAQAVGDRTAAGGHQQMRGAQLQLAAVAGTGVGHDPAGVPAHRGQARVGVDGDALVGEDAGQGGGNLGFLTGGQPAAGHHGDLAAQAGEQLGLLQADVPGAQHQQAFGQYV